MKLAFMHIPKTAGTSLRQALPDNPGYPRLLLTEREENVFHLTDDQYRPDSLVFGHLSWQMAGALGAHLRAVVLREPIARCLSQAQHWFDRLAHLKETDDVGWYSQVVVPERGFFWNVENLLERQDMPHCRALANAQVAQLACHHIYRPDRLDECWLELATNNLELCAAVGITERMPAFVAQFGSLLGVKLELQVTNRSRFRSDELAESLPASLRAKLLQQNELDVELYQQAAKRADETEFRQVYVPVAPVGPLLQPVEVAYHAERDEFEKLKGDFWLRFCHFIVDIAETQIRFGISGDFFLDRPVRPREAALIAGLGKAGRLWTTAQALDTAVFTDFAIVGATTAQDVGRYRVPEATVLDRGNVAVLRLGLIQGRSRDGELAQVLDTVASALAPLGVVVVIDAMTLGGASGSNPSLLDMVRAHGLSVAVYVDKHAVLCRREWVWFYHALARGKFTGLEIIRTRQGFEDVLMVDSDY